MKKPFIIALLALVFVAMGLKSFHLAKLGIHDIKVAILVNQHIAGQQVPRLVCSVSEMPFAVSLCETQGSHVGVNHHLCGGTSILDKPLSEYRHDCPPLKACEAIKGISRIKEDAVMPYGSFQQANNRTAIKKVVDLVDYVMGNVCVIFIATGTK